ncbi:uncharacterized protein L201_007269 [Kwoniella dendrophila CBS 6074]|uniref:HMG box domain-containing protein n=1 Tax=Kwoniella dendrophila CBS 6074 TaxID=1295534 RepID=A0AAX4K693_9TREE
MASSETSSYAGSIASRRPSLAPSRASSILSTPPTEITQPNEEVPVIKNSDTPSGSPPDLSYLSAIPPMIRRASQFSTSSDSSAAIKDNTLPLLQVTDQSGIITEQVLDPALTDEPIPSINNLINNEPHTTENDNIQALPYLHPASQEGQASLTQLPALPLTQWPSLPSLNLYNSSNGGTDTEPSTQTNSPTSPNSLWASSFNNSLTDLNSEAFGSSEQGDNDSDGGYQYHNTDNQAQDQNDSSGTGAGVPAPKKKSHARKQPEGHIKRARNAFILFRKHITDSNLIPPSVEVKHQNISVVAAKMWKEAPLEVRAKFNEQARIEKEEHARKYPGYRYQPVFRRTDIIRRRVRKDPSEDEKVDAVAELLIKGKSGDKLEEEIKEQIIQKTNNPEVATGNDSDSNSVLSQQSSSSRSRSRRRRDAGQLSKGAIRAQKAQARAKQMRQNLLGTNLLNMSLYNAATNRLASSHHHTPQQHLNAAQQHAYATAAGYSNYPTGTAVGGLDPYQSTSYQIDQNGNYIQVGYDEYGRPIQLLPHHPGYQSEQSYPQTNLMGEQGGLIGGHENEMYRLPPIEGMMDMNQPGVGVGGYSDDWQTQPVGEYWDQQHGQQQQGVGYDNQPVGYPPEDYYNSSYGIQPQDETGLGQIDDNDNLGYRLPPLELTREGVNSYAGPGDLIASQYIRENPSSSSNSGTGLKVNSLVNTMKSKEKDIPKDGQQTPSNHVLFNERLFDGALGTAGLNNNNGSLSPSPKDRQPKEKEKDEMITNQNNLDDDELNMFDKAMEHAGGISDW